VTRQFLKNGGKREREREKDKLKKKYRENFS
jgi:hypothetical protein